MGPFDTKDTFTIILKFLDSKSLLNSSAVSKSWKTTIDEVWTQLLDPKKIITASLDSKNLTPKQIFFDTPYKRLSLTELSANLHAALADPKLNPKQRNILNDKKLHPLIEGGHITINEAITLSPIERQNLGEEKLWPLFSHTPPLISIAEIKNLTHQQRNMLCEENIQTLILQDYLSLEAAKKLEFTQRDNLKNPYIFKSILEDELKVDVAKNFTMSERNEWIRECQAQQVTNAP